MHVLLPSEGEDFAGADAGAEDHVDGVGDVGAAERSPVGEARVPFCELRAGAHDFGDVEGARLDRLAWDGDGVADGVEGHGALADSEATNATEHDSAKARRLGTAVYHERLEETVDGGDGDLAHLQPAHAADDVLEIPPVEVLRAVADVATVEFLRPLLGDATQARLRG